MRNEHNEVAGPDAGAQLLARIVSTLASCGGEAAVQPLIDLVGSPLAGDAVFAAKRAALTGLGGLARRSGSPAALGFLRQVAGDMVVARALAALQAPVERAEAATAGTAPRSLDTLAGELAVSATIGLVLSGSPEPVAAIYNGCVSTPFHSMNQAISLAGDAPVSIQALKTSCSACSMHQLCLPMGLEDADITRLDQIIGRRRRLARDERLYGAGEPFRNLYAVRFGHFKTYQLNAAGEAQITGFQMAGELLGMDAISGSHHCDAVALEDSEVCEIPFSRLEELFGEVPALLRHFHRIMSQEITREQNVMLLLGNMRAEQRFAVFLVNLSARYAARGYSAHSFQLRMSREDIGNYLGLTIESVSRLLSRFKKQGWLQVDKREVTLLDPAKLKALAAGLDACSPMG